MWDCSWDNCICGIDTGVLCLLSGIIKAGAYYLFVLLVSALFSSGASSTKHMASDGEVKANSEQETIPWICSRKEETENLGFVHTTSNYTWYINF
jgi:hypothetical protein